MSDDSYSDREIPAFAVHGHIVAVMSLASTEHKFVIVSVQLSEMFSLNLFILARLHRKPMADLNALESVSVFQYLVSLWVILRTLTRWGSNP